MMSSAIHFSAVYKTANPLKQKLKYEEERDRAASQPFTGGPVIKDEVKLGRDRGTFLVCTEEDAIRLNRAATAYELQHMKVAIHGSRGYLPPDEYKREKEYRDSYRAVQREMLAKAESLD